MQEKKKITKIQKIIVFQQKKSGVNKIKGVRKYGQGLFNLEVISIDADLLPVIEDAKPYLPGGIEADLVLDFLKHPDLSHDLLLMCEDLKIPVVASGKKVSCKWSLTPPT